MLSRRARNVDTWFFRSLRLPGDVAECGVYLGGTSQRLARYLEQYKSEKTLHMFDWFGGVPDIAIEEEKQLSVGGIPELGAYSSSLDVVQSNMASLPNYVI